MDLLMDARDAEAGKTGGTPRTIEGPLYVEGAPLVEGDANLSDDPDDTDTLRMTGQIKGPGGEPAEDAILHVWHANSKGFYSHFDQTGEQIGSASCRESVGRYGEISVVADTLKKKK